MAKIIIIGGGVAGLAAGIYARLAGHEAVIYEKHSVAGGNLTGWKRGEKSEYLIDNCIHWLTGTNPNTGTYKMWEELGALGNGVELLPCDTLYTCRYGERSLSLTTDLQKLENDMFFISPDDAREIKDLIGAVKVIQGVGGIAGDGHNEKISKLEAILALPLMRKYFMLSTGELAGRFRDPLLKRFLTRFISDKFMSLALVIVFAHYTAGNGGLPKGGSIAMAERMIDRFVSLGGELVTGREAVRINCDGRTARSVSFSDGSEAVCDYVVVTCDPSTVFGGLIGRPMPASVAKKYASKSSLRFSCWHTAFSCDLPGLSFKGDLAINVPEKYRPALKSSYIIIREFSHDSFAPAGKSIIQTMVFCGETECRRFIALHDDAEVYGRIKKELAETVKELIEEELPETRGKLDCLDVWTPATYKRYTGSGMGSFMAFALPERSLPVRIPSKCGLKNVRLASQWNMAPGGLPVAAGAGKRAAEEIAKLERRKLRMPSKAEAPAAV